MKCLLFLITFIFSLPQTYAFLRSPVLIDVEGKPSKKVWTEIYQSNEENIKFLIQSLSKSPLGKNLIVKAKRKASYSGKTLLDIIKVGDVSITDTTLVRKFSASSPDKMVYVTESEILIDRSHLFYDALLDLAHELTHYIEKDPFNPYDQKFTMKKFVHSTVEGKGGEVDAYLNECRVLKDLSMSRFKLNERCASIYNFKTKSFNRHGAVKGFYSIGPFARVMLREIKDFNLSEKDFPHLSSSNPDFISSAYGLPYPLAAVREYATIMNKVCLNDEKRIDLMRKKLTRSPASAVDESDFQQLANLSSSFESRCRKFVQSAPSR